MAARARDPMTTARKRKLIMYMLVLSKMSMPKLTKLVMRFKENNVIFKDGTVKDYVVGICCPDQTQG